MAYDEALAERVRKALARRKNIEEKRMFAGIGFLLSGNLLVSVRSDSLLVRVGEEQGEAALQEPHVSEFVMRGRAMKGWLVVDMPAVETDEQVKSWLARALQFVSKLPAK